MSERRLLRRDEDADTAQSPAPRRERPKNSETASILDLQSNAGNRAVAQLLESRVADPALASLQRQPAGWRPGSKPANDRTMTIPDMKLTMPIISFSHRNRGAREVKDQSGVVDVTVAVARADAGIYEAVAKGRQFDTITIALGSRQTLTLKGVVISDLSIANEIASLGLTFTSMELTLVK